MTYISNFCFGETTFLLSDLTIIVSGFRIEIDRYFCKEEWIHIMINYKNPCSGKKCNRPVHMFCDHFIEFAEIKSIQTNLLSLEINNCINTELRSSPMC